MKEELIPEDQIKKNFPTNKIKTLIENYIDEKIFIDNLTVLSSDESTILKKAQKELIIKH